MFWNIFYKLCEEKHTKPNAVAKIIGASSATCTKWKNGTIPNGDTLLKLADYLDVSVDYLLGRTNNPNIDYSNGITSNNNSGNIITASHINGNNNSNINTGNKSDNNSTLDDTTIQIATAFQNMSLTDKAKVITLIAELTEKNKTA